MRRAKLSAHQNFPSFAPLISAGTMTNRHQNKTLATFLATTFGSIGLHRFYLHGIKDLAGWMHTASVPLALLFIWLWPAAPGMFNAAPWVISAIVALGEALAIGLTADDKWDASHNPASGQRSASGWPLAAVLVLTSGIAAIAVIAAIARTLDLLFTGGAYG